MIARRIDLKHHIDIDGKLYKSELGPDGEPTGNGAEIPADEPLALFRGRDRLAVPMLLAYRALCVKDGCNEFQLEQMDTLIKRFTDFAYSRETTMKQPGVTKGAL